jgi:GxxExxY protein
MNAISIGKSSSAGAIVEERDPQTFAIIGAALEVHRALGPGHLEAVYHEALQIELDLRGMPYASKPEIAIEYKGRMLRRHYEPDFVIYNRVVVEIKAQSALSPVDEAQLINSLKCCRKEVGLLINFGEPSLCWKRFVS